VSAAAAAPLVPMLIIGAVVVTIGVGACFAYLNDRKRTAALADVALRLGFNFEQKASNEEAATLGSFHLFKIGRSRKGKNLMRGKSDGADAIVLDYQYTIGSGKSSHTLSQTVVIYPGEAGGAALPDFTLGPEHWWDRFGEILGHRDINFESSEEFSKHYLLKGPDEAAIRTVFGAEPLGFFAQHQGWSVESAAGSLVIYHTGRRAKPEEMQPFLTDTAAVRRTLVRD
jgi:carbonic anhydrase